MTEFIELLEAAQITEEDDTATGMRKLLSRPEIRPFLPMSMPTELIEGFKKANDKQQRIIAVLKSQLEAERARKPSNQLLVMIKTLMDKQGQLLKANETLRLRIGAQNSDLIASRGSKESLEMRIDDLMELNRQLRERSASQLSLIKASKERLQSVAELKQALQQLESPVENQEALKAQNRELQARLRGNLGSLTSMQEINTQLQATLISQRQQSTVKLSTPEKLIASLEMLRRGHDRAKELNSALEQMAIERQQLLEERNVLQDANGELGEAMEALGQAKDELEQSLSASQQELLVAKARLEEAELCKEDGAAEELSLMQIRLYALEERNSKLMAQHRRLVEQTKQALPTLRQGVAHSVSQPSMDTSRLRDSLAMHQEAIGVQNKLLSQVQSLQAQLMEARSKIIELRTLEHRHVQYHTGHVQAMASMLEVVHHKQTIICNQRLTMVPKDTLIKAVENLKRMTSRVGEREQAAGQLRSAVSTLTRQCRAVFELAENIRDNRPTLDTSRLAEANVRCFQLMSLSQQTISHFKGKLAIEKQRSAIVQGQLQSSLINMSKLHEQAMQRTLKAAGNGRKKLICHHNEQLRHIILSCRNGLAASERMQARKKLAWESAQRDYRQQLARQTKALHRSSFTLHSLMSSLQTIAAQRDIKDVERQVVRLQREAQKREKEVKATADRLRQASQLVRIGQIGSAKLQAVIGRQQIQQGRLQPFPQAYMEQSSRLKLLIDQQREFISKNNVAAIARLVQDLYEECRRLEIEYLEVCAILHAKLDEDIGLNRGKLVTADMVEAEISALQAFTKGSPTATSAHTTTTTSATEQPRRRRRRSDAMAAS